MFFPQSPEQLVYQAYPHLPDNLLELSVYIRLQTYSSDAEYYPDIYIYHLPW